MGHTVLTPNGRRMAAVLAVGPTAVLFRAEHVIVEYDSRAYH